MRRAFYFEVVVVVVQDTDSMAFRTLDSLPYRAVLFRMEINVFYMFDPACSLLYRYGA